jgi:hypothetical protein
MSSSVCSNVNFRSNGILTYMSEKNQKIKELEQINKGLLDGQQTSGAYLLRGSNLNKRV